MRDQGTQKRVKMLWSFLKVSIFTVILNLGAVLYFDEIGQTFNLPLRFGRAASVKHETSGF